MERELYPNMEVESISHDDRTEYRLKNGEFKGFLHRDDGPAVEFKNGKVEYFLGSWNDSGNFSKCSEYGWIYINKENYLL